MVTLNNLTSKLCVYHTVYFRLFVQHFPPFRLSVYFSRIVWGNDGVVYAADQTLHGFKIQLLGVSVVSVQPRTSLSRRRSSWVLLKKEKIQKKALYTIIIQNDLGMKKCDFLETKVVMTTPFSSSENSSKQLPRGGSSSLTMYFQKICSNSI